MVSLNLQSPLLGEGSQTEVQDVIVLGGGPAGLTAGLYAARAGRRTLLLERGVPGGQVATTELIENYPGGTATSGPALMAQVEEQARRFGVEIVTAEVAGLTTQDGIHVLHTDVGDWRTRTLIIATGAHPARLGVEGEDIYRGQGVSYCATCDGPFFRNEVVAVVGGGDSAIQEADYLTRFAREVVVIHRRDNLRAARALQERAFANPRIRFVWNQMVERVAGNGRMEKLVLRDVQTGERSELAAGAVFVYVGMHPNTEFLRGVVELDEQGYVITDEEMRTSVPGIFAAGDVRRKSFRQMVTATADGAIAANSADHYLQGYRE